MTFTSAVDFAQCVPVSVKVYLLAVVAAGQLQIVPVQSNLIHDANINTAGRVGQKVTAFEIYAASGAICILHLREIKSYYGFVAQSWLQGGGRG